MGKKLERLCALLLAAILVLLQPGMNQAASAVTIRLSKTVGSTVKVTGGSNNSLKIRKNMKLYSGYRVTTGKKSYAYLLLDKTKAVKLNQNTAAGIKKEGKKNEVHLEYGKLFFNVSKKLASGETVNVKTSNNTMGIRGTSGTVTAGFSWDNNGNFEGRNYTVQIYDGKGYITYREKEGKEQKEILLQPGQQLIVRMDKEGQYVIKTKIIQLSDIPSFTLEEMLKDADLLERVKKEMGLVNKELTQALKENRKTEAEQEKLLEKKQEEAKKDLDKGGKIIYAENPAEAGLGEERGDMKEEADTGGSTGGGGTPQEERVSRLNPVVNEDMVGIFDASLLNEELEKSDRVILQTAAEAASYMVTDGQVVIGTGKTLTVPEGMSLSSYAVLNNSGTFENNGKESFHNYGKFINVGTVNNQGTMTNESGGYMENQGTFHIKPGAQCYNYAGDASASFINKENASLVIKGSFINGQVSEEAAPPTGSPDGQQGGFDAYQSGVFNNYGTVEGTLVNEECGYLLNQGTVETLDSKGIVKNTGVVGNGYTPSAEDNAYYTLSFIEKNGRQWDLPQKRGKKSKGILIEDSDFNGWDKKLEELHLIEQDYTVHEYPDAQKPECVIYSYGYDYGYGISFQDLLEKDKFDSDAYYNSIKLNKDIILQADCTINWDIDLVIKLNGHLLDLNGYSIAFGDGGYGKYGIQGSQEVKEDIVLNYDESRGDYAPILANDTSILSFSDIGIQVSKGKAIEVAPGGNIWFSASSLNVNGGTGILAKGKCTIESLELTVSGGTGIAVESGGTLELSSSLGKALTAMVSGGIGIHSMGGTLNLDENIIEKTEIPPGIFLKED